MTKKENKTKNCKEYTIKGIYKSPFLGTVLIVHKCFFIEKPKIKDYSRDTNPGEVINITMAQMEEKMANNETFVVCFATTYCMYCKQLHVILDDYLKDHHVVIYQVILDLENATEEENLTVIHKYFEEFYTTPGVFYVKKGINKSYLNTYTLGIEEEIIDQWVRENQIDKKRE